jgi:flagella basal body P-ring formation protein FlgA
MKRALFTLAVLAFCASAYAEPAKLKEPVIAYGPALTLGDLFALEGPAASRAVAPAPAPGRTSQLSVRVAAAAATAGGVDWNPPEGLQSIPVSRGERSVAATSANQPLSAPVIRRGETLTLVYASPGVQLATRVKALADAREGETVRVVNPQSERVIDAIVTGPGAAVAQSH